VLNIGTSVRPKETVMAAHAEGPLRLSVRRAREAAAIAARPVDIAAYWLVMAGVYTLVGFLWYYAAKSKIFDDVLAAPAGIQEQFSGSFVASFPGIDLAWAALGILQGRRGAGSLRQPAARRVPAAPEQGRAARLTRRLAVHPRGAVRLMPPYRADRWLTGSDEEVASERY
jgi:hypothetical protein